jgi:hypothetical protein
MALYHMSESEKERGTAFENQETINDNDEAMVKVEEEEEEEDAIDIENPVNEVVVMDEPEVVAVVSVRSREFTCP